MAGRKSKHTVDYFPHYCRHGKTIEILEQRYGIEGYAFWFKLLERLADTDDHFLDCRNVVAWEYLQTKTRQSPEKCTEILNLLASLGAIDQDLWTNFQVIWSDNFIANVADVYRNRRVEIPTKPNFYCKKLPDEGEPTEKNTQSKVKQRKEEKRIKDLSTDEPLTPEIVSPNGFNLQSLARLWNQKAPPELPRINLPFTRNENKLRPIQQALKRHPEMLYWQSVFRQVESRPFLLGKNDRNWLATFDFIVTHCEEIMDGAYSDAPAAGTKHLGLKSWFNSKEDKTHEIQKETRGD